QGYSITLYFDSLAESVVGLSSFAAGCSNVQVGQHDRPVHQLYRLRN
ncbi:hypothetical protein ALP22_04196, partial [Pseudomonas coronafaciens pv. porri]